MHFPKFWARGECQGSFAWKSSDFSLEAAEKAALESAQALHQRFKVSGHPERSSSKAKEYEYGSSALREETIQTFTASDGRTIAILSRNAYGSLILNTESIMFIDIDQSPETSIPRKSILSSVLSMFQPKQKVPSRSREEEFIESIQNFVRSNPGYSFRVYRTKAGYRLLATTDFVDPSSSETTRVFRALKADPLYEKLCQRQKCFRARVSPKPWRCDSTPPPSRWPLTGTRNIPLEEMKRRYEFWLNDYAKQSKDFASCKFLLTVGRPQIHSEIEPIVRFHDEASQAMNNMDLA